MEQEMSRRSQFVRRFPRLGTRGFPALEFGRGWDELVMELLQGIDRVLSDPEAASFEVLQAKEKWGILRVYWTARRPYARSDLAGRIDPLMLQARQKSELTCMSCGAPGILRTGYWVHVSCEPCEIKHR